MMHGCEKALQSCKSFVQGCEKALQGCKSFKHLRNGFASLQKALRHTHKKDKESSGQVAAMWKATRKVYGGASFASDGAKPHSLQAKVRRGSTPRAAPIRFC